MLTVIIPVFNAPSHTAICLDSLYSTDHGSQIVPVVVDNGSRKKTKQIISDWKTSYSSLSDKVRDSIAEPQIITLDKNTGFAGAVNAAMTHGPVNEYVLILHNDCIPFTGCIGEMLSCFQSTDDEIAAVVPRTNYDYSHFSCVSSLREKFEKIKPSNKERTTQEEIRRIMEAIIPDGQAFLADLSNLAQTRVTYSPDFMSYCLLTKSDYFQKYGLWDESFWPRYWEDKWWWRSLERDGLITMVANKAFAFHFGSITADGPGFNGPELFGINEQRYRDKCIEQDRGAAVKIMEELSENKNTV